MWGTDVGQGPMLSAGLSLMINDSILKLLGEEESQIRDSDSSEWPHGQTNCP